jgi:hypothetical protein
MAGVIERVILHSQPVCGRRQPVFESIAPTSSDRAQKELITQKKDLNPYAFVFSPYALVVKSHTGCLRVISVAVYGHFLLSSI